MRFCSNLLLKDLYAKKRGYFREKKYGSFSLEYISGVYEVYINELFKNGDSKKSLHVFESESDVIEFLRNYK